MSCVAAPFDPFKGNTEHNCAAGIGIHSDRRYKRRKIIDRARIPRRHRDLGIPGEPPPEPSLGWRTVERRRKGIEVKAPASISRRLAIVAAAASALVLSGCAAGQIAQTAEEVSTLDGVHAKVGDMALTLYVQAPDGVPCYLPGAAVPLALVLVNTGQEPDTLDSITSPRFTGTTVAANAADAAKITGAASGSGSCGGTAASASAAPGGKPSGLPQAAAVPTLAPNSTTQLGITDTGQDLTAQPVVLLEGLQGGPLFPGESVPLTLTFHKSGKITLMVPVHLSLVPHTAAVPSPTFTTD
jgi:hypothetical protein